MSRPDSKRSEWPTPPTREALDELPPHSEAAEAGVLGCLLLSPGDCLSECEERGMAPEWFYGLRHRQLFAALREMDRAGQVVDLVTVAQWLRDRRLLEEVGGLGYVAGLPDQVPSAANLEYYVNIVFEKWQLRRVVQIAAGMSARAMEYEGSGLEGLIGDAQREVLQLSESATTSTEVALKEAVLGVVDELEDFHRGKPQIVGVTTGLEYLDKILLGLGGDNGNYIVVAGRPGTGKTSLAMQIALHAALDYEFFEPVLDEQKKPVLEGDRFKVTKKRGIAVGVFSMEMTQRALTKRTLFQRGHADMQRWRTGFAVQEDFTKLIASTGELLKSRIWIDDTRRQTIETVKAKARRWYRQHGVRLFVLDYLQLMRSSQKRFREDRVQELEEISGELQAVSSELNCPFLVLAQMNRDYDKEPTRLPRLSDLKNCGAIEQDADLVIFLHKPHLKDKQKEFYEDAMERTFGEDWSKHPKRVNALIAKYRNGPADMVAQLLFHGSSTRFEDWNVWLKARGLKAPAAGERASRTEELPATHGKIEPEDANW